MSCKGLLESLLPNLGCVLEVRDEIGAVLKPVSFVTRTWSGTRAGDGTAVDVVTPMKPSPAIVEIGNDIRILEAGAVKQGDHILKSVSKLAYPLESDLDCSTSSPLVEKFYLVGDKLHSVINIKEKYVTWDILVRQRSDQTRY
jgi:hypothetical protein